MIFVVGGGGFGETRCRRGCWWRCFCGGCSDGGGGLKVGQLARGKRLATFECVGRHGRVGVVEVIDDVLVVLVHRAVVGHLRDERTWIVVTEKAVMLLHRVRKVEDVVGVDVVVNIVDVVAINVVDGWWHVHLEIKSLEKVGREVVVEMVVLRRWRWWLRVWTHVLVEVVVEKTRKHRFFRRRSVRLDQRRQEVVIGCGGVVDVTVDVAGTVDVAVLTLLLQVVL